MFDHWRLPRYIDKFSTKIYMELSTQVCWIFFISPGFGALHFLIWLREISSAADRIKRRKFLVKSLRTEVRGDLKINGTKYAVFPSKIKKLWCFKPPVNLVDQATRPLHEILTRLVIIRGRVVWPTKGTGGLKHNKFLIFDGKQHPKNIWFHGY